MVKCQKSNTFNTFESNSPYAKQVVPESTKSNYSHRNLTSSKPKISLINLGQEPQSLDIRYIIDHKHKKMFHLTGWSLRCPLI